MWLLPGDSLWLFKSLHHAPQSQCAHLVTLLFTVLCWDQRWYCAHSECEGGQESWLCQGIVPIIIEVLSNKIFSNNFVLNIEACTHIISRYCVHNNNIDLLVVGIVLGCGFCSVLICTFCSLSSLCFCFLVISPVLLVCGVITNKNEYAYFILCCYSYIYTA